MVRLLREPDGNSFNATGPPRDDKGALDVVDAINDHVRDLRTRFLLCSSPSCFFPSFLSGQKRGQTRHGRRDGWKWAAVIDVLFFFFFFHGKPRVEGNVSSNFEERETERGGGGRGGPPFCSHDDLYDFFFSRFVFMPLDLVFCPRAIPLLPRACV